MRKIIIVTVALAVLALPGVGVANAAQPSGKLSRTEAQRALVRYADGDYGSYQIRGCWRSSRLVYRCHFYAPYAIIVWRNREGELVSNYTARVIKRHPGSYKIELFWKERHCPNRRFCTNGDVYSVD